MFIVFTFFKTGFIYCKHQQNNIKFPLILFLSIYFNHNYPCQINKRLDLLPPFPLPIYIYISYQIIGVYYSKIWSILIQMKSKIKFFNYNYLIFKQYILSPNNPHYFSLIKITPFEIQNLTNNISTFLKFK